MAVSYTHLALALCLSLGAHAAGSTTATVPVTLTVDNEYRAVNVTVPASLPIEVINGTVLTAENARITNNSKSGSVRVSGVEVTDGAYKVGSYNSFSGAKTIALKINGCPTEEMCIRDRTKTSTSPLVTAMEQASQLPSNHSTV